MKGTSVNRHDFDHKNCLAYYFILYFCSCPPPELPTYQDCHELWSKRRRRQMREQQEQQQRVPVPGGPTSGMQVGNGRERDPSAGQDENSDVLLIGG